jgi:hypothetical protein
MTHLSPVSLPQWFLPLFIGGAIASLILLPYASGWPALAKRFQSTETILGERFRFVSGSVYTSKWFPVSYRNCLFLTVNDAGFGISVLFPFNLHCSPLFIPWAQVKSISQQDFLWVRYAVIKIHGSSTTIRILDSAGQSMIQAHAQFRDQ